MNAPALSIDARAGACEQRLADNLRALAGANPAAHASLLALLPEVEITVSEETPTVVSVRRAERRYSVAAAHPAAEALSRIDNRMSVCLISGIGSGAELLETLRRTEQPQSGPASAALPVYLLEPDPCALLAALCLYDFSAPLVCGRLLVWTGAEALEDYARHMSAHRQALFPTHQFAFLPPSASAFAQRTAECVNRLIDVTAERIARLEQAVAAHYAGQDVAAWRNVYTTARRPLRIMGCTSRFTTFIQYCIRDLLAGFERLGCATLLHQEESAVERTTQYDLLATIDAFKPDLILYIDHFRDEFAYIPRNVPFVNWIQDLLPNITRPAQRHLGALDFTFVFAPQWLPTLAAIECYADHDVRVLPLGINPDIYHPLADCPKTFDVLYVSHLVHPAKTLRPVVDPALGFEINAEESELLADGLISFEKLILVYMLMTKVFDGLLIDDLWKYVVQPPLRRSFVKRILGQAGIAADDALFEYFCTAKRIHDDIGHAIKTRPLIALARHGTDLRIYGNHWETVPGLSSYARGPAENGAALNTLMNQAKICLNNSPGTSLHMRALEILGAGAFLLSRDIHCDTSDIKDHLKENEETVLFRNETDIARIVRQWLDNDAERERMASLSHSKAMDIFSYDRVAGTILDTVRKRLSD